MHSFEKHDMRRLRFLGVLLVGALATSAVPLATASYDRTSVSPATSDTREPVSSMGFVSAAAGPEPNSAPAVAKCEEAEVNPVTGHAECIRPRGAAVDPPPQSAVPCSGHYAAGAKHGCPQQPPKDDSGHAH